MRKDIHQSLRYCVSLLTTLNERERFDFINRDLTVVDKQHISQLYSNSICINQWSVSSAPFSCCHYPPCRFVSAIGLRNEAPPQFLPAAVHRQPAGAVSTPTGEVAAAALVGMECAALPPQPEPELSCVHCLNIMHNAIVSNCSELRGRMSAEHGDTALLKAELPYR